MSLIMHITSFTFKKIKSSQFFRTYLFSARTLYASQYFTIVMKSSSS